MDPDWDNFSNCAVHKDFYYSRQYHIIEECRLGRKAFLLTVERDGDFIGIPMLLSSLEDILGRQGKDKFDASCVYGYVGPIFNREDLPREILSEFKPIIDEELKRKGVVSFFSRLHPLFNQHKICDGLGEVLLVGETISIDLSATEIEQRAQQRLNLRRNIKKATRHGLEVREDLDWTRLSDFVRVYHDTMERVTARAEYRFAGHYLENLRLALGSRARLFLCFSGHDVVAGAIFVQTGNLVQFHLAGTRTLALGMSPMSLLISEAARLFSCESLILHLGGGVGGLKDGVFHFKSGFSRRRHSFFVWRWVIDQAHYQQACFVRPLNSTGYFPPYRTN
jgi:hypothetical protein